MKDQKDFFMRVHRKGIILGAVVLLSIPALFSCVSTKGTAMESHRKGMEALTEQEYFIPKKPIDRAYIGCAWSKQFGPVEDPAAADIRIKKEKSFNNIQQDFAYNLGVGLGGQTVAGPQAEIGAQGGSVNKANMEGVEIITPISLADIPFEPNIPYITEALRLGNFRLKEEKSNKAGLNVSAGTVIGSGSALAQVGSQGRRGTEGDGLVVAYKLHAIDIKSYEKKDSGSLRLDLDKAVEIPSANLFAKARLQMIEAGANKSLPRNVIWSCAQADAASRDMVAAWVIDLKTTDPKRKSLAIAFPAWPKIEDCQNYSSVIYSRIDPLSDKIIRQKIAITVIDSDVTENMRPKTWDARISLINEAFNIKPVTPGDMEGPAAK